MAGGRLNYAGKLLPVDEQKKKRLKQFIDEIQAMVSIVLGSGFDLIRVFNDWQHAIVDRYQKL